MKQGKKLEETFDELLKMEHQVQYCKGYDDIRKHLGNKKASKECSKIIFNV